MVLICWFEEDQCKAALRSRLRSRLCMQCPRSQSFTLFLVTIALSKVELCSMLRRLQEAQSCFLRLRIATATLQFTDQ